MTMEPRRLRVGIAGLQPGRSWAARAHVPALRALSGLYEIAGVANTSRASAETERSDNACRDIKIGVCTYAQPCPYANDEKRTNDGYNTSTRPLTVFFFKDLEKVYHILVKPSLWRIRLST